MPYKIIFAIAATIIGTAAFAPYFKDIFLRRTQPHVYTWLIWAITQSTAVAGILYGHGGIGALELTIGTAFVFLIFLFSLKYGSKNITKTDTAVLVAALLAVVVWWKLHEPLAAIILVSAIDLLGYVPSFRKSFQEPWSETVSSWIMFVISNCCAIVALREYNALTLTYIVSITVANAAIAMLCLVRRSSIHKPLLQNIDKNL